MRLSLPLVLGLLCLLPSQEVEARRGSKLKFRTLTFNIRYDFANDGHNRWQYRADMVARVIEESRAHLVCLQEDKRHQVEDLQQRLKGFAFVGRGRNASGSGERCSILYATDTFKLKDSGDFWLSDTPDVPGSNTWGDRYPRKVTWALLSPRKRRGKTLLVLNTHFVEGGRSDIREKAAGVLLRWLDQRLGKKRDDVSVVITGDFNSGADEAPHRILTASDAYHLRDTWEEVRPQDPSPGTFNGFRGLRTRQRIDWILLGGPTRALQATRVDYNEHGNYPSDHYPVLADLEIR